jgi:ABC-type uncharacterized transport system involved in gliding motility auxiliary subunit
MPLKTTNNTFPVSLIMALGLVFITIAVAIFYVEQRLNTLVLAPLLAGVYLVIVAAWQKALIYKLAPKVISPNKLQGRPIQWRKKAVVAAVVVFAPLLTVAINYHAQLMPYRWDVTEAGQHTLNSSTTELIRGLNSKVDMTALYVGTPPKYLEDMLKEYSRISAGNITTDIVDPIVNIGQAAKFGNVISGKESKLIIRAGVERKDVDFSQSSLTEEQVSNALLRVSRKQRQVYFLTGHGEYSPTDESNQGLSTFASLLHSNNVSSKSLMLGIEDSIPEDCDVLIIAGPRKAFTEAEQGLIESYLNNGGDALLLVESVLVTEPDQPLTAAEQLSNPSLNAILNQWGLHVGSDIVVDLSSHVGSDVGSPATRNYMRHKAITAGLDYTFYVRPRSLTVLEQRPPTIKLAPIVLTASKERSWAETNRHLTIEYDEGVDIPGPVPISFVIWQEKTAKELSDTRMIVFTDADFLSNAYINQYSNAEMGLNIVNWLSDIDYRIYLDQQQIKVERLDLASKQRRIIIALLVLLPLLIAAAGLLVWTRL